MIFSAFKDILNISSLRHSCIVQILERYNFPHEKKGKEEKMDERRTEKRYKVGFIFKDF
jgi:hypothetical protein